MYERQRLGICCIVVHGAAVLLFMGQRLRLRCIAVYEATSWTLLYCCLWGNILDSALLLFMGQLYCCLWGNVLESALLLFMGQRLELCCIAVYGATSWNLLYCCLWKQNYASAYLLKAERLLCVSLENENLCTLRTLCVYVFHMILKTKNGGFCITVLLFKVRALFPVRYEPNCCST